MFRWRSCSSPRWAPPAIVTGWLKDLGINIYAGKFSLFTLEGVLLAYMYFQIPLMVLIILPALEGLRPAWREAAEQPGREELAVLAVRGRAGAGPRVPWLCAAAVRQRVLGLRDRRGHDRPGALPLTAIQIGSFLNGNVIAGQENVGKALGLGMILIIAIVMIIYTLLQRRAARWLR